MDKKNFNIIGFLGTKHSGKDTAGNYIIQKFGYKKYAFGDPVKQICKIIFCILFLIKLLEAIILTLIIAIS